MPSPDEIAQLAMNVLGQQMTASMNDDTADGRMLKRGYDTTLAAILGGYPWRFAHARIRLAQSAPAPDSSLFTYAYELPSDCLQPKRISEDDRLQWERQGDKILTMKAPPLLLEYTRLVVDPGLWPGTFVTAFITLLASVYAGTFKNDYAVMKELRSLYYQADLPEAKTQDARAASINQIRVPTLTTDQRIF